MIPQVLDPDTERYLQNELDPGEKLMWSGAPSAGRMARMALPATVGGILFLGIAICVVTLGNHPRLSDLFKSGFAVVFIAIFFTIPLLLALSPLWAAAQARRTVYAVTSRRAIILVRSIFGSISMRAFYPPELGATERVEKPDGSGDVILATIFIATKNGQQRQRLGFFGISDAKAVHDLVQSLAKTVPPGGFTAPAPVASRLSGIAAFFVGSLFMAVGLAIVFVGVRNMVAATHSVGWPVASAVVLSSQTVAIKNGYRPDITYRYQVGDRTLVGTRLTFGNASGSYEWARGVTRRYAVGQRVQVRYDPSSPKICVLEAGIDSSAWLMPVFGLFFLGAGGLAIFLTLRTLRSQRSQLKRQQAAGMGSA
jgi:hypothetical protein